MRKIYSSVQNIYFAFTCSYMMSNGYKPAPLDLSDVKLLPPQEVLVDKLAENAHNVWAKDRIKQGWTYGIQQVRDAGSGLMEKPGDVIIYQKGYRVSRPPLFLLLLPGPTLLSTIVSFEPEDAALRRISCHGL